MTISPARSPARRGRAARAVRREGRLPAEAVHDDARRRRHAARRRREDRTHPPGRKPAAVVGAERAVPEGASSSCAAGASARCVASRSDCRSIPPRRTSRRSRCRRTSNYDMWLGPTPEVYYTEQRVHPQGTGRDGGPTCSRGRAGCATRTTALGMITGWGAHHFDTAHWGMDMELTGPSKRRRARRVPAERPHLERARRVSHRAHVSGQRDR